jgi:hypothetical protein
MCMYVLLNFSAWAKNLINSIPIYKIKEISNMILTIYENVI